MCIGLHTLPPCLLFCGNYILHESEYDVHIFCVALDIIIYLAPVKSPFPGERGQFGMDAEIRTHQALHEAKPSECPNGDRDNKSEVCFKNRLFLQAVTAVFCGCFFSPHYLKSRRKNAIIVKVYRQTLMSVGWK